MVRPDARDKNLEMKIDTLFEHMASLTLLIKQKVEPGPSRTGNVGNTGDDRACSYCGDSGHIAARWEKNPNKDRICCHCGKKGHIRDDCWARRRDMRKSREEE